MGGVGISITGQRTGSEVDDHLGSHQGQFFPFQARLTQELYLIFKCYVP